ncbi:MAG: response regulator [Myxococcales bacterium]|jgi:CheY-like chemotaxis protein|nr:response regulator [Myxococcales bacterium]
MMTRPAVLIVDDTPELLKLLAHLIRDAGFDAMPADRGKEALRVAQERAPALAIIDLLLPDMTGYQLADSLRRVFPNLPIVFLTGVFKGPRQAHLARQKYGVTDYFEKPFDAWALVAAVRRLVPLPTLPDPYSAPMRTGGEEACEEERPLEPMELSGIVRFCDGRSLFSNGTNGATTLVLQPPIPSARSAQEGTAAAVTAVNANLNAGPAVDGVEHGALKGNLPQLISAYHQSRQTGALTLTRGRARKTIFFRQGRPVFADSNLISDRFGPFLVRVGKLSEAQLSEMVRLALGDDDRVGDHLVQAGLLSESERLYFMGQQVKSIVYSAFCWEDGAYEMTFRDSTPPHPLEIDFHPANLILRSIRRLYKPERLRRLLTLEERVIPSLQPTYALSELELEPWEAQLLPKADGTRTVADLISLADRPPLEVQAFVYAMIALNVLERRA